MASRTPHRSRVGSPFNNRTSGGRSARQYSSHHHHHHDGVVNTPDSLGGLESSMRHAYDTPDSGCDYELARYDDYPVSQGRRTPRRYTSRSRSRSRSLPRRGSRTRSAMYTPTLKGGLERMTQDDALDLIDAATRGGGASGVGGTPHHDPWVHLYESAQKAQSRREAASHQGRYILEGIDRQMMASPNAFTPDIGRSRSIGRRTPRSTRGRQHIQQHPEEEEYRFVPKISEYARSMTPRRRGVVERLSAAPQVAAFQEEATPKRKTCSTGFHQKLFERGGDTRRQAGNDQRSAPTTKFSTSSKQSETYKRLHGNAYPTDTTPAVKRKRAAKGVDFDAAQLPSMWDEESADPILEKTVPSPEPPSQQSQPPQSQTTPLPSEAYTPMTAPSIPIAESDEDDDDDDDFDSIEEASPASSTPQVKGPPLRQGHKEPPSRNGSLATADTPQPRQGGAFAKTPVSATPPPPPPPDSEGSVHGTPMMPAEPKAFPPLRFAIGDAVLCSTPSGRVLGKIKRQHEKGKAYRISTELGDLYAQNDHDTEVKTAGIRATLRKQNGAVGIIFTDTKVVDVGPNTPADGKVPKGCTITVVDGTYVRTHDDVQNFLKTAPSNDPFDIYFTLPAGGGKGPPGRGPPSKGTPKGGQGSPQRTASGYTSHHSHSRSSSPGIPMSKSAPTTPIRGGAKAPPPKGTVKGGTKMALPPPPSQATMPQSRPVEAGVERRQSKSPKRKKVARPRLQN